MTLSATIKKKIGSFDHFQDKLKNKKCAIILSKILILILKFLGP